MNKDLCHSPHNFIRNVDIIHWYKSGQTTQCVDKTKLPPKTCTDGQTRKRLLLLMLQKACKANYINEVITQDTQMQAWCATNVTYEIKPEIPLFSQVLSLQKIIIILFYKWKLKISLLGLNLGYLQTLISFKHLIQIF